jgi:glycosyltransferase involved in cell wall biosynthesis
MPVRENSTRIQGEISIALCTCEGSFFLPALLESLVGQSCLPGEIVVCDDASTDDTAAIVKGFAKKAPFAVRLVVNDKRLGAVKNFEQAISLCRGKYIALCDQDDLWKVDKLDVTYAAMLEAERNSGKGCPLLVHTDLEVIDAQGSVTSSSFLAMRRLKQAALTRGDLKSLVMQNYVTGCTVLMNRALAAVALPFPGRVVMHDHWLTLVATALGQLIYLDQPTVLYRQHQANVIGASSFYSGRSLKRVFKFNKLQRELSSVLLQATALETRLKETSVTENHWLGRYLRATEKGGLAALKAALQEGVLKQGFARNLFYLLMLLTGGYRRYL